MARRSPRLVNQKCETGCTSRMFGIFNFHEARSDRRLVSNGSHLNKHTTGQRNGKSKINSDVLSTVDEKYPHAADASSRRKRGLSCKNICVEDNQIADLEKEVTKMIVNQRFFDKNSRGKDGVDCQPNQFLDAVQILYSNKELFVKLLQDPNSLLVKQIHDLQKSQVKAEQNGMTRLNKAQNSGSFVDRSKSSSDCETQSSKRIVVLKPKMSNVKEIADSRYVLMSGSLVQAIHDQFEENHLADIATFSLDPMNKSNDIISEVLQAFSLKCDEPIKSYLSNLLTDSSTFEELNGLTDQLSDSKILHDCIIQCFMDLYQSSGFLPQFSSRNSNFFQPCVVKKILVREINELVNLHFAPRQSPITLQQVVEKDLGRRGSWMNIHVDTEDIAIEVEEDVLEKLVLEIVSDMDIRDLIQCNETMSKS
ncbi:uncharacterized protein LOC131608058 isoform X2 [Vicia villosa]|uniref:uncharacterized protein LOC131608058 isoform X2 n=1 Tax=Vicia villosa TaxID=3911 RepID=UPI00273C6313|nr:uncharacterized protein LOC131608058 isoform X2 [Vicia villosa]